MRHKLTKIDWNVVESNNIHSVFFDDPSQTILIKFNSGGLYSYIGANETIFNDFMHSGSLGSYLHTVIKAFPYTRWDSEQALLDHLNLKDFA